MNHTEPGDDNSMFVLQTFNRLLADVRTLSGTSLDVPDKITYSWVLNRGPELDKKILGFLEHEAFFVPDFWQSGDNIPDSYKFGPMYLSIMEDMPEWLMPLWTRFLERGDGFTLRLLRTVLLFCYKVEHQPSEEQINDAQSAFEENDRLCGVSAARFNDQCLLHVFTIARQTVGSIIYRNNWKEIVPQHGPGGVYPPRPPADKSCFFTLYESIDEHYPFYEFFCGISLYWWDHAVNECSGSVQVHTDIVAKLVAVPKDSRGPRLICVHPAEAVWIQLGLAKLLEASIERNHRTRGKINFTDQSVNARLALHSSSSQRFSTLDLKEASDRISCELVRHLFGDYVYSILSCCRANKIKLLDGRVLELRKWAPMGNGLTFPVQSLIFWSLVTAGIYVTHGVSCDEVYVFGDDIIFPSCFMDGAIRGLVCAGLVPNMSKTFAKGFFRESCGTDAFKGTIVTPLRMKKGDINSLEHIVSNLDLAKRLRRSGYEQCAAFLYTTIRRRLGSMRIGRRCRNGIYLPISNDPDSAGLYEYQDISFAQLMEREPKLRFRSGTQVWGCRTILVGGLSNKPLIHDWYHVQDSLLAISRDRYCQCDRGTEYAIPYRTRLIYGWTSCLLDR